MAKKTAAASPEDQPTKGEIYKTNRPTEFDQVVGQPAAVRMLSAFVARKEVPRFLLFTGPSGVGKTTLARILRVKLRCKEGFDFQEINCASNGGIDAVRKIEAEQLYGGLLGPAKVYILDEFHGCSKDAFQAFLKILEDTPQHTYFMACTTETSKIPKTIMTRATEVALTSVNHMALTGLVVKEAEAAHITLAGKTLDAIVNAAEGSPRMALVMLNKLKQAAGEAPYDEATQLEILRLTVDRSEDLINLVRALGDQPFPALMKLMRSLPDGTDAETVRRITLAWWSKVVLGGNGGARGIKILKAFRPTMYDTGMAGVTLACHEVCS